MSGYRRRRPHVLLSPRGEGSFPLTIGHNIASKAEVDEVMEQARRAGAVIVKPAQDTFWGGYSGYFQDPDEHLWEVAVNPQWVRENEE